MKKCVIASDTFKGTLTSSEIASIFECEVKNVFPSCEVIKVVVADGGEGTIESINNILDGKIVEVDTKDANLFDIKADYLIVNDNIAIIEVAKVIGLPITKIKDPTKTSSFGVGKLIKDAINKGCKKIVLGLGGSSTNDSGVGIAYSLGAIFYNENHESFLPVGESLNQIVDIDDTNLKKLIKDVQIIGMCDVKNVMTGLNGASYTFAKQKGANDSQIKMLDDNLKHLNNIFKTKLNKDISLIEGTGAAGAIGAIIVAMLNGKLSMGIDTILDIYDFDNLIFKADYVFTGEGRVDEQSFNGKVIAGVIKRAKYLNIPVISISGCIDKEVEDNSIDACFTTLRDISDINDIRLKAKDNYKNTLKNILKLIYISENNIKKDFN